MERQAIRLHARALQREHVALRENHVRRVLDCDEARESKFIAQSAKAGTGNQHPNAIPRRKHIPERLQDLREDGVNLVTAICGPIAYKVLERQHHLRVITEVAMDLCVALQFEAGYAIVLETVLEDGAGDVVVCRRRVRDSTDLGDVFYRRSEELRL